jgi:hypothetical protein
MGGTMRLGTRTSHFKPGTEWSKLRSMYGGAETIEERHRHRYEVNPEFIAQLEKAGLAVTSYDDQGVRVESIELKDHPFFVAQVPQFSILQVADPWAVSRRTPSSRARCCTRRRRSWASSRRARAASTR